ncbi:MAG TPA: exosortase K [Pyrinomonadaceae bacterium]|nr:exosortase K [Pyrinomonadaceae bacterium]
MHSKSTFNRLAQLAVVLLAAVTLKQYYSTASVNQLRWILAPTTAIVEVITGSQFHFEANAGYMNKEGTFLIAASCAGVNFLLTAFLMLSLRRVWLQRITAWKFIPAAALFAYVATLIANTVRISTALQLQKTPLELSWLTGNQLHRLEGIFIYFGFLLLLFLIGERIASSSPDFPAGDSTSTSADGRTKNLLRQSAFPLLVYYATTIGIPIVTAAYRRGSVGPEFWEHLAFVSLTPLVLLVPVVILGFYRRTSVRMAHRRSPRSSHSCLASR